MYKEAVQKMPKQFAPHSLFNMMGTSGRLHTEAFVCMSRRMNFPGLKKKKKEKKLKAFKVK